MIAFQTTKSDVKRNRIVLFRGLYDRDSAGVCQNGFAGTGIYVIFHPYFTELKVGGIPQRYLGERDPPCLYFMMASTSCSSDRFHRDSRIFVSDIIWKKTENLKELDSLDINECAKLSQTSWVNRSQWMRIK